MKANVVVVCLLSAALGLVCGVPGALAQVRGNLDALGAATGSIDSLARREAENADPRRVAAIANSGSTNTLGYQILVPRSGHATWTIGALRVHADIDRDLVDKFYSDLRAAQPLSSLAPGIGVKSASFGTSTTVTVDGQTSPDVSLAGDARGQALWADVVAINNVLGARDLPRRPMLDLPQVGPHGHLPSSAYAIVHLGPQDNGRTVDVGANMRLAISLEPPIAADAANAGGAWSGIDVSQPRVLGIVSSDASSPSTAPSGTTGALLITTRPGTVVLTSHLMVGDKSTAEWRVTLHVSGARLSLIMQPTAARRG